MKLMTELQDGQIVAGGHYVNEDCVEWYQVNAMESDALAAHALTQSIKEWWDRPPKDDSCTDGAVTWIECRADALLAEWTKEG